MPRALRGAGRSIHLNSYRIVPLQLLLWFPSPFSVVKMRSQYLQFHTLMVSRVHPQLDRYFSMLGSFISLIVFMMFLLNASTILICKSLFKTNWLYSSFMELKVAESIFMFFSVITISFLKWSMISIAILIFSAEYSTLWT